MYEDENIKVEYILNNHITSSPSYPILVTEGKKRVLFSGDMSNGLRACDVPASVLESGVDAFVCELAHFSIDDIAPYLDRVKTGRLFFTHVYPLDKYDGIKAIKGKYPLTFSRPETTMGM